MGSGEIFKPGIHDPGHDELPAQFPGTDVVPVGIESHQSEKAENLDLKASKKECR